MIPHHVYYQLAILGLFWLCIMLHYIWPSRGAVAPQPPAEPVSPQFKHKRSKEPTHDLAGYGLRRRERNKG
jgi:hypothetical protein